jgi:hypothetical protein
MIEVRGVRREISVGRRKVKAELLRGVCDGCVMVFSEDDAFLAAVGVSCKYTKHNLLHFS